MVPQFVHGLFIFYYKLLNWWYDESFAIFHYVEMDDLWIGHGVSVDESPFIFGVLDGIEISFETDAKFLVWHENLRPYKRLDMEGIHGQDIFRDERSAILLNQMFRVNGWGVSCIQRLEHFSSPVDYAWWGSSFWLLISEIGRRLGNFGPFAHCVC